MRHAFVVGQVVAGLVLYALAAVWDGMAANLVLLSFAGALISCLICRWRPGLDAPWRKLLLVGALTNLAMLMSLGELAVQLPCLFGRGSNCFGLALTAALFTIAICLALLACGLLWRWRSGRSPA